MCRAIQTGRSSWLAAASIVALLAVAGCAAPTQAEIAQHAEAQKEIAGLINEFAEAVRSKDAHAAAEVFGSEMYPTQRAIAELELRQSIWLRLYTGYKPDAGEAAAKVSFRAVRKGVAELKVPATNDDQLHFVDRYTFARRGEIWDLVAVKLQEPLVGEDLDPPQDVTEKIRAVVKPVMKSIENKTPTRIMTSLPPERTAHYRVIERTFWQKLLGAYPGEYGLYEDLELVNQFEVLRWPNPDEEMPLGFIGPTYVVVAYDIPYTWPEGGIHRPDILCVELFLVCKKEEWRMHRVRLYGKGIPGTE